MLTSVVIYIAVSYLAKAQTAHLNGNNIEATEWLGNLYIYLDDFFESKAREKCESAESHKE